MRDNIKLCDQYELVKSNLIELYNMLINKLKYMESINAPRPDIRKIIEQIDVLKAMLRGSFDFDVSGNDAIFVACKLGDKY